MSSDSKARKPYRYGVRFITAEALGIEEETPVTIAETVVTPTEITETQVEVVPTEVITEETTQDTIAESTTEEVTAEVTENSGISLETAGFSAKSIQMLSVNNIFTVEELVSYMESGETLEALPKIGKVAAKKIEEELAAWNSNSQPSQEATTQDS